MIKKQLNDKEIKIKLIRKMYELNEDNFDKNFISYNDYIKMNSHLLNEAKKVFKNGY